jgi:hypothetical protein
VLIWSARFPALRTVIKSGNPPLCNNEVRSILIIGFLSFQRQEDRQGDATEKR